MRTRVHAAALTMVVMAMLLGAAPAGAQSGDAAATNQAAPARRADTPKGLHVLIAAQATLLSADMITTASALQFGGGAREGNPLLRPFSQQPAALAAVSAAIDALQMYTIVKLNKRHPKIAHAWALALVGTELFAVTNNLRVTSRLRRPTEIR